MKTLFFKGIALGALFIVLSFVANGQEQRTVNKEILSMKVQELPFDNQLVFKSIKKSNVLYKRPVKISQIKARPVDSKELVRKAALPTK